MTVTKGTYATVHSINELFCSVILKSGSLASPFSFQSGLDLYHWEKTMKVTDSIKIWKKWQHFMSVKSLRKESVQKVRVVINNSERLSKPTAYSK